MNSIMAIQALHAASTLMMTGLIWFVQCVHYPLMVRVGGGEFAEYEREHVRRTTWIVAPLMMLEAASAAALLLVAGQGHARMLAAAGMTTLMVIWVSTIWMQVPCHRRLGQGLDESVVQKLVATNWVRTILWTVRSAIAVALPWVMRLE